MRQAGREDDRKTHRGKRPCEDGSLWKLGERHGTDFHCRPQREATHHNGSVLDFSLQNSETTHLRGLKLPHWKCFIAADLENKTDGMLPLHQAVSLIWAENPGLISPSCWQLGVKMNGDNCRGHWPEGQKNLVKMGWGTTIQGLGSHLGHARCYRQTTPPSGPPHHYL